MLSLCLFFVSCKKTPITESNLIGKYQVELPQDAIETLELLPQGKCIENIKLSDGKTYDANGTWKILKKTNHIALYKTHILLESASKLSPNIALSPFDSNDSNNTGDIEITHSIFGGINLCLGEMLYYKKIN